MLKQNADLHHELLLLELGVMFFEIGVTFANFWLPDGLIPKLSLWKVEAVDEALKTLMDPRQQSLITALPHKGSVHLHFEQFLLFVQLMGKFQLQK